MHARRKESLEPHEPRLLSSSSASWLEELELELDLSESHIAAASSFSFESHKASA